MYINYIERDIMPAIDCIDQLHNAKEVLLERGRERERERERESGN